MSPGQRSLPRGRIAPSVVWCALGIALAAALVAAPMVGPTRLDIGRALGLTMPWGPDNLDAHVFFTTRLPRVLFALVAGGALALSGAVYQALLRNDLAEPYSLGVASGSALGALVAFHLIATPATAWLVFPLGAMVGAGAGVAIIYGLARLKGPLTTPATLLLAGVTLNFLFGSLILLVQYLSDPFDTVRLMRWLMGGLDVSSLGVVGMVAVGLVAATATLFVQARAINALAMGEQSAHHLGVPIERTRIVGMAVASALTALVVAFAGPVGFVGLIVPHFLRRLLGADARLVLPACVVGGGVFLAACDTVARTAMAPVELPVGIITAALGAPVFLAILLRSRAH